jgi:hypothetical protein
VKSLSVIGTGVGVGVGDGICVAVGSGGVVGSGVGLGVAFDVKEQAKDNKIMIKITAFFIGLSFLLRRRFIGFVASD